MRIRLRPAYDADQLARIYAEPHNHREWKDHRLRVQTTIAACTWFDARTVADLSAGDAAIIQATGADVKYIGDYAPGYEFTGAIEDTIDHIPNVDLFILSETLEHLDNPDAVLAQIRAKTRNLILTTPNGETNTDNPQHYWGWDNHDVEEMLRAAKFNPQIYVAVDFFDPTLVYNYQIWGCS